jgi:hypothetical protein
MNWIEGIFGIDPDLGSGSLELLIAGAVVFVVAGAITVARGRKGSRARRAS